MAKHKKKIVKRKLSDRKFTRNCINNDVSKKTSTNAKERPMREDKKVVTKETKKNSSNNYNRQQIDDLEKNFENLLRISPAPINKPSSLKTSRTTACDTNLFDEYSSDYLSLPRIKNIKQSTNVDKSKRANVVKKESEYNSSGNYFLPPIASHQNHLRSVSALPLHNTKTNSTKTMVNVRNHFWTSTKEGRKKMTRNICRSV